MDFFMLPTKTIYYNLSFHLITEKLALDACQKALDTSGCTSLLFVNAHCFNLAQTNKVYHQVLQKADLVLNDGIGIKLGGFLNNTPVQDNLNGTDLIPKILALAAQKNQSVFLLGGKPGVAQLAKEVLEKTHAKPLICGIHDGYFTDARQMIEKINASKADVLVVGMGVPLQELFIEQNKHLFTTVRLAVAGGAVLDFISGTIPRAPVWIRSIALEWLYRLVLEPKRLWKRYIWGNLLFFFYSIRYKIQKKS